MSDTKHRSADAAYASRPTDHLQPVHHEGLFRQASDDRKLVSACQGEDGMFWLDMVGRFGMGRCRHRIRKDETEVADWWNRLNAIDKQIGVDTDGRAYRTTFSIGVKATPCTSPAPAPAMEDSKVGCRVTIEGAWINVCRLIGSCSSSIFCDCADRSSKLVATFFERSFSAS